MYLIAHLFKMVIFIPHYTILQLYTNYTFYLRVIGEHCRKVLLCIHEVVHKGEYTDQFMVSCIHGFDIL